MTKARQLADLGNAYDDGALSNRNRVTNGSMAVAQRGISFTVTNEYSLDRWFARENTDGALTFSQDSESPVGLSKSLKVNVDTADTSIGSSQFAYLAQRLEGFAIEPFAFGSSDAKKITLSFYVRCSVTGKFGGAITNGDNNNRSNAFTYDVNAANTWERKTITFDGDTTGTWNIDNTQEMAIFWSLGAGSSIKKSEGSWDASAGIQSATEATSELIGTASATWFITGVQLEVGDTATPFEHRSYGDELAKCQRYYFVNDPDDLVTYMAKGAYTGNQTTAIHVINFPTTMRASPTIGSYTLSQVSGVSTVSGVGFCRFTGSATASDSIAKITSPVAFDAEL